MGADCADGEKLIATPGDKNRFAKRVTQNHLTIGHLIDATSLFEIQTFQFACCFSHKILLLSHWNRAATDSRALSINFARHGPYRCYSFWQGALRSFLPKA